MPPSLLRSISACILVAASVHTIRGAPPFRQFESACGHADSLLVRGSIDSARAAYAAILGIQGSDARALVGLGKIALLDRDWDEALSLAGRVLEIEPENIPAHYVAAIARREIGAFAFREAGYSGPSRYGDWGKSRSLFKWVLGRDSSYEDVLYQFSLLLRYEGDRDGALAMDAAQIARKPDLVGPRVGMYGLYRYFMLTEDSTDYVSWMGRLPGSLPRYFTAEIFRRHGNLAAAESLLDTLLSDPDDVSPQAVRLSLARVNFRQGDRRGAETEYWNAVSGISTPIDAAILFDDLKYIVSDWELEYFTGLDSVGAQKDFFRSFWNFRNPSPALNMNLRLQEHMRRFIQAEQKYEYFGARTSFNNPDRQHELAFPRAFTRNDEFNDMGLIYLRQGDPDDIVRHEFSPFDENAMDTSVHMGKKFDGVKSIDDQVRDQEKLQRALDNQHLFTFTHDSYESWLYNASQESPRMMFHFQKHNAVGNNWRFVPVPSLDAMIEQLQIWDTRFQRLYEGLEDDRIPLTTQMKADAKDVVRYALSTEKQTWEKKTGRFTFPHSIDVFRSPRGGSLIDVSYAIPLASLSRNLPDSVKSLPVEIGFSMIDARSHNAAVQRDTMDVGFNRSRTGAILDLIRYTVPADSYAVSMHIRPLAYDMIGTWHQALRVRDFSGGGFMMSSIQFLRPSAATGALAIDGVKVVQSPLRTQLRTEPFLIYFQLYNLVPDLSGRRSYRAECLLLPKGERDIEKGVTVYSGGKNVDDEMAAVFCTLDVRSFSAGSYTLVVRVTDTKRVETLTAERDVNIVGP